MKGYIITGIVAVVAVGIALRIPAVRAYVLPA